ncbi:hypothetical protein CTI12_AA088890 [Artemisia annua]|uniref:Uncharacterized protein n=1 Tax=Artemisia annua TaxID=35608 RepID=A0A2U1Q102_ARTAN|nr:hypothetical protein CTI12_AA088890 [Artemisia annua]
MDLYDLEFEMVNRPVDKDLTLNDTITSSCDLVGTNNTIGHAINRKMDLGFEMVNRPDNQDSTTLNDMITSSTELIDTTIEDATNNKKTLASTMDSVISLMRQVESEEKAAGQAKAEAAISGLDIRLKVEELKQAQQRAKETNEMHAKEVYSQKDVIATQMKEFQSRVSDVLHEGSKSVTLLDEMCIALEKRLASALKEKESAEKEKLEKETLAREALAYEESQMKKLVEESERLKQEEMNNSKLQQFLVDRGNVVDMLDGDISKKCQDVKLLKESLDQEAVLVEVFSSQTSPIIASSRSPLTNEVLNKAADSCVVIDKILSFGLHCSTDDHDQAATLKPLEIGKSVTLVAAPEHKLLSDEIPNEPADSCVTSDKNFVLGLKIAAGDHVQSATQRPIESGKPVTLDVSQEHKLLANEIPNEKNEPADSSFTLDKNFVFGQNFCTGDHAQSATQKPTISGKSVTLVTSSEHKLSINETPDEKNEPADDHCQTANRLVPNILNFDKQWQEGIKNVGFDLKKADITKVGNAKSTENLVNNGQTFATGVACPPICLSSRNKGNLGGRSKKGKVTTSAGRRGSFTLDKNFVFGQNFCTGDHAQSATQKPTISGKSVTLVTSSEHKLSINETSNEKNEPADDHCQTANRLVPNILSFDKQWQEGIKNVGFDLKKADITKVGNAKSTENLVNFGQTFATGVACPPICLSSRNKGILGGRSKKGKVTTSAGRRGRYQ